MSWARYNQNTKKKIDSKRDDSKRDDSKRDDSNIIELNITTTDSKKPKVAFGKQFIDYIDAILYINLEHRHDRNEHCLNEIRKIDPLLTKTHRIEAVCNKSNGALGCTLSHIKALQLFLDNPTWNTCIIFEDDFTFISNDVEHISNSLLYLFNNSHEFDVLLLGVGSTNLKTVSTKNSHINKVHSSQTTSGYVLTKKYANTLLSNFITSSNNMITLGWDDKWCADQYWKHLMPEANWYALKDRIGYQYGNYSDIEKTVTDYKC
jgi:GR25 family glycosyltransferase involved in LPS biosynthesis